MTHSRRASIVAGVLLTGVLSLPAAAQISLDAVYPPYLIFNRAAGDYIPNPLTITATAGNNGDTPATNGSLELRFDTSAFQLYSSSALLPLEPRDLPAQGGKGTAQWMLMAKKRSAGDSLTILIVARFDNRPPHLSSYRIWIPAMGPILHCALSAPEIRTNAARDRYVPMPFALTADIWNAGGTATDSLVATLVDLEPALDLAPNENHRRIKSLLPPRLGADQHASVSWEISHPIAIEFRTYTLKVCFREYGGDSLCCTTNIAIPPLLSPVLNGAIDMPISLSVSDSTISYLPTPFTATVSVRNNGGVTADSVHAILILPEGMELDPPGQDTNRYFSPMRIVSWRPSLPVNNLSWSLKVPHVQILNRDLAIKVKIMGVDYYGATDTLVVSGTVHVPGLKPIIMHTHGINAPPDTLLLNPMGTGYLGNPFTARTIWYNVGRIAFGLQKADCFIFNGPAMEIQSQNPVIWNAVLQPGDSVVSEFTIFAKSWLDERVARITVITTDQDGDPMECFRNVAIPPVDSLVHVEGGAFVHDNISLAQNYPNPFSRSTIIRFDPGGAGTPAGGFRHPFMLKVYDLLGREVLDLTGQARSGNEITIDRANLKSAGNYFYRLLCGGRSLTRMMTARD